MNPPERLRVFAYVDAEKAALYRPIMRAFLGAKERFGLHLRPDEIVTALRQGTQVNSGAATGAASGDRRWNPDEVESALLQLCDWGNLEKHVDTSDVATIEDFYHPRHLFQLTGAGEAAERAVQTFEEAIQKPGELQTAALGDIRMYLGELERLATEEKPDEAKVHQTLGALRDRFEGLTTNAQIFIGGVYRQDLVSIAEDRFIAYKEKLIDYIQRFVGELALATIDIAAVLERVERSGIDRLLRMAGNRDLIDRLEPTDAARDAAISEWSERWRGLRSWFKGEAGFPSESEILRAHARRSIRELLTAVAAIHDRRRRESDRPADLRALARWFAETDSDEDAHRLWRAAFGLAPSRHLKIDRDTLALRESEPVTAQTSWLEAPPIRILPQLRATGRHRRPGGPKAIVDRAAAKAWIEDESKREMDQVHTALHRFASGRPRRLDQRKAGRR